MKDLEALTSLLADDRLGAEDIGLLVQEAMNIRKKEKLLQEHKYKLYQGKDGRWFTRFPDSVKGSIQRAFKTRELAEEAIVSFYSTSTAPSLSDIFHLVIDQKLEDGSISPPTHKRHSTDFKRFYGEIADKKVDEMNEEDLENHIRAQKRIHDLDAKGYARLLSVTRIIFRYAKKKKMVNFRVDDLIADMDWGRNAFRKEERDDEEEVFDDTEVGKLASYFKDNPDGKHLGLLLCFVTGLRVGELSALKWDDISDAGICIRRTERAWSDENHIFHCEVVNLPKTKAGKRIVPIPEQARWIIEELRRLNPDGEFVFMYKGNRTRTGYFRKALQKACDAVEIPRRAPHKIRKTYASILLDNNVAAKTIIENMGHMDISTTNTSYARRRRTANQRIATVNAIPEFDVVANEANCSSQNKKTL